MTDGNLAQQRQKSPTEVARNATIIFTCLALVMAVFITIFISIGDNGDKTRAAKPGRERHIERAPAPPQPRRRPVRKVDHAPTFALKEADMMKVGKWYKIEGVGDIEWVDLPLELVPDDAVLKFDARVALETRKNEFETGVDYTGSLEHFGTASRFQVRRAKPGSPVTVYYKAIPRSEVASRLE